MVGAVRFELTTLPDRSVFASYRHRRGATLSAFATDLTEI